MHADEVNEVWKVLDRERLAEITVRGPQPVFAAISGAHLYGFASEDSDVDLRGAFLNPLEAVLGLHPPPETISVEEDDDFELDWVAHDLRKFVRLMTNHNGYVLEQLFSPLVVVTSDLHAELIELGKGCVTRGTSRHYLGFAKGRLKRLREPNPTVKHLLYGYRVLLTGIRLMQSGEVVSNLNVLNEEFAIEGLDELIERKRNGTETMALDASEVERHEDALRALMAELEEARDQSSLPEEPTTEAALDDLVVRARLRVTRH